MTSPGNRHCANCIGTLVPYRSVIDDVLTAGGIIFALTAIPTARQH